MVLEYLVHLLDLDLGVDLLLLDEVAIVSLLVVETVSFLQHLSDQLLVVVLQFLKSHLFLTLHSLRFCYFLLKSIVENFLFFFYLLS